MAVFNVKWELEVEAETAEEAVMIARQTQLDKDSEALGFDVSILGDDDEQYIDLADKHS